LLTLATTPPMTAAVLTTSATKRLRTPPTVMLLPGGWVAPQSDDNAEGAPGAVDAAVTLLSLPAQLDAVGRARGFARDQCTAAGVAVEVADTVVLLTSEAVTNAFVHGRSAARLTVTVLNGRVRVEVADDNSRHPRQVEQDDEALDGRGLLLMTGLALRWGVRDEPVGKTVWFEVQAR